MALGISDIKKSVFDKSAINNFSANA